jgi:hypothetical protein
MEIIYSSSMAARSNEDTQPYYYCTHYHGCSLERGHTAMIVRATMAARSNEDTQPWSKATALGLVGCAKRRGNQVGDHVHPHSAFKKGLDARVIQAAQRGAVDPHVER